MGKFEKLLSYIKGLDKNTSEQGAWFENFIKRIFLTSPIYIIGMGKMHIYDAKSLCDSLVEGGRKGISVQSAFSSEEEVQVKAIYTLKLSVPFFRPIRFQKDTAVKRRVFSGYVKHRRDYDAAGDNSIVYVAENGVVYHKNASCSHICLKITGNAAIQDIVHSSKYAACEKCIHKGSSLSAIFVTAYGDCYHSTLGCSGLKRTIKAVRLKDVGRLRPCSRCASGR